MQKAIISKPKKKISNHKYDYQGMLGEIEELAAKGASYRAIAIHLGINLNTFQEQKKYGPFADQIQEAYEKGKARSEIFLTTSLHGMAAGKIKGNVDAAKYLLNTIHGFTERSVLEIKEDTEEIVAKRAARIEELLAKRELIDAEVVE